MRRGSFALGGRVGLGVAAALLVSVTVGVVWIRTRVPAPGPSTVPTSTAAAATAPAGYARVTAPGISFLYPEDWTPRTFPAEWKDSWSNRYLALISDGPPECWLMPTPLATGPGDEPCIENGQVPGQLQLFVSENTRPVPGEANYHRPVSFEASPTYELGPGSWYVTDPGGGIYRFQFTAPYGEIEGRRDEIVALIDSVTLSDWERPSLPSVDGRIALPTGNGTFTYPDAWTAYRFMPWYVSTVGVGPILLFASKPVEPCIPVEGCHLRDLAAGTVVIEVNSTAGPFQPDWNDADTHIGGRPAISGEPWVYKGIQGLSWNVQGDDPNFGVLGFQVAMSADPEAGLQRVLDEFLAGFRIADAPSTEAP